MSLVRDLTRLSRAEHRAFHSRDCAEGMWTEGKSIRLETSLSTCASFLSVFTLRLPTPKDFTRVAGTTLTSCPIWIAWSATAKASEHVSSTTRLKGRISKYLPSCLVRQVCSSTI